MSRAILTFDYELFLGNDSGTALKSIIEPTNEVLKLLKENGAKAIFFVDATYLLALKKYKHNDLKLIEKQLKEIVSIGSSVELHLHPQWLDAIPKGDRWKFKSFDRYRLHSLDEDDIEELFYEGKKILESITNREVVAFRAGGWSITPFEKLKNAFIKNSIKIDMSVLSGFYNNELPMHYYDFLNVPQKEYYRFENDVTIEDKKGSFLEILITTYYMYGIDLVINNLIKKMDADSIYGDGKGLTSSAVQDSILKRVFKNNIRKATIESQSEYFFRKSLKKIGNRELLSYVMHPKTLNRTSLKNFEYLLQNYETLNSNDLIKEFF